MEEGNILNHLIYLFFDEGEKPFKEEINISKSYEVDQIYCCTKFYLDDTFDTNYEVNIQLFEESKEKFINGLFEIEKNYHLFQHNTIGSKFNGALLLYIPNSTNKKQYHLILYQSNKRKINNRISNDELVEMKDMIVDNLEFIFNIEIKKVSFFYILEYENKDNSLIEFCEKLNNGLQYILYSLSNNKFVDIKGNEISIKKYMNEIKPANNIINFIGENNERNNEIVKKILNDIPNYYNRNI